jgi:hypothetical protein
VAAGSQTAPGLALDPRADAFRVWVGSGRRPMTDGSTDFKAAAEAKFGALTSAFASDTH